MCLTILYEVQDLFSAEQKQVYNAGCFFKRQQQKSFVREALWVWGIFVWSQKYGIPN